MDSSLDNKVNLQLSNGNRVVVHKFGATVISYICNGTEILFLSEKAVFDNKKAIRGGIPVVFPNFGPWDLGPQHGFARISMWNLDMIEGFDSDRCVAQLSLCDSDQTRAMWNYGFKLTYTVTLCKQVGLKCELTVYNTDQSSFDFTVLLHTYIRVKDVEATTVSNLGGLKYDDKLRNGNEFIEDREKVDVIGGADRVYKSTPTAHVISDSSCRRPVLIEKVNLPDTVVWNPWAENASKMSDFGDTEYKAMICVEPGSVSQSQQVGPGEKVVFAQTISVTE